MIKQRFALAFLIIALTLTVSAFTQQDDFVYSNGKQKITLVIGEGQQYLRWDEPTKMKMLYENIDPRKMAAMAPGLSLQPRNENFQNQSNWKITVRRNIIEGNTLKLTVRVMDDKDSVWIHVFKIPIKEDI